MPEPLLTCLTRHLKDPKGFEAHLAGRAILLFEPPEEPDAETEDEGAEDTYRFRTSSGIGNPSFGVGEPTVAYIEKTKDNAFQRRITLGRTANNDIEIDAPSVSRFHAWFQLDETLAQWTIVDAGSKNGTQLAGHKLVPKKPAPLPNNTRVRVGHVDLTFFTAVGFLKTLERRGNSR